MRRGRFALGVAELPNTASAVRRQASALQMAAEPGQRIAEAVQRGRLAVAAAQRAPDPQRLGEQRERLGAVATLVLQVPEAGQREAGVLASWRS